MGMCLWEAFDDGPEDIGETGIEWLKIASETAQRRYGFTRCSVVRMLIRADGLPRNPAVREVDVIAIALGKDLKYQVLAGTPLEEYPEPGRPELELEALMVRRSVLANFLRSRDGVLSLVGNPHQPPAFDVLPANESRRRFEEPAHLRGRPQKASWPRIVQLVRQLASEHPDWQRKRLAFEAWSRAREEFSESELPSVATIQRSMVDIFDIFRGVRDWRTNKEAS
jgi:hypothetical protein